MIKSTSLADWSYIYTVQCGWAQHSNSCTLMGACSSYGTSARPDLARSITVNHSKSCLSESRSKLSERACLNGFRKGGGDRVFVKTKILKIRRRIK
jgi:hypothetical protein